MQIKRNETISLCIIIFANLIHKHLSKGLQILIYLVICVYTEIGAQNVHVLKFLLVNYLTRFTLAFVLHLNNFFSA